MPLLPPTPAPTADRPPTPRRGGRTNTRSRRYSFTAWPRDFMDLHDELLTANVRDFNDDMLKTTLCGLEEKEGNIKYLVVGLEVCPETNRQHLQGYIELRNGITMNRLKAIFGRTTHVEDSRGTPAQNRQYCIKEANFIEFGTISAQGKQKAQIENAFSALQSGRTLQDLVQSGDVAPDLYLRYSGGLQRLAAMLAQPWDRNTAKVVKIIIGPSGSGKTRSIFEQYPQVKTVTAEKHYVHGAESVPDVVLFDDFDPSTMTRTQFLRLTDRYPMDVRILGGTVTWRPHTILFTNNRDPECWTFACGSPYDAACSRRVVAVERTGELQQVHGAAAANFVNPE